TNNSSNTQTFNNSGPVVLYNDQSVLPQNGDLVFNSTVDLGGGAPTPAGTPSINVGGFYSRKNVTFNGKLTNSANIFSQGLGTLTLANNSNDFTGTVNFIAGTLKLTASNALGAVGSFDAT